MYDEIRTGDGHRMTTRGATQASIPDARALESEQFFSLSDAAQTVRKRLWLIILVTLIFVGSSVGFSLFQTPTYGGSAKILVGQNLGDNQAANLSSSVEGLEQLAQTMVEAINSRPVAEDVIQRLGLQVTPENLLNNLTVEQVESTPFITLYYEDPDPERAQSVVNTVADVSSERISRVSAGANNITAPVWERATLPEAPVGPSPVRNGLLAFGLGLMLGTGLVFLLEYLDDSWRSPEEVERVMGIPTFGVIPALEFELAKNRQKGY